MYRSLLANSSQAMASMRIVARAQPMTTTTVATAMRRRMVRGGDHHYKGYNEPSGHLFDIPVGVVLGRCVGL